MEHYSLNNPLWLLLVHLRLKSPDAASLHAILYAIMRPIYAFAEQVCLIGSIALLTVKAFSFSTSALNPEFN